MYNFQQNKATKRSISLRKPINGMGLNDADYVTQPTVDGKIITCPIYRKWSGMLMRCYSAKYQEKNPTYIGYTVSDSWLIFSNFRAWMIKQDYYGLDLDKDIKLKGNTVYSSDNCLFIPHSLNSLLNDHVSTRGHWPVGVSWHKGAGRFQAQITIDGKTKPLGRFTTPEEASEVYQAARTAKIKQLITDNVYPMATPYLEQHL